MAIRFAGPASDIKYLTHIHLPARFIYIRVIVRLRQGDVEPHDGIRLGRYRALPYAILGVTVPRCPAASGLWTVWPGNGLDVRGSIAVPVDLRSVVS